VGARSKQNINMGVKEGIKKRNERDRKRERKKQRDICQRAPKTFHPYEQNLQLRVIFKFSRSKVARRYV